MKKNKVKGFTLVELLAVIVILAIILVIAVPRVMSIIEDAKKGTLESTAKMIASSAEKRKVQNTLLGNTNAITCESVAKINNSDYESCSITFDNDGIAQVTIKGKGKFANLYVCNGTKTNSEATDEGCTPGVEDEEEEIKTFEWTIEELAQKEVADSYVYVSDVVLDADQLLGATISFDVTYDGDVPSGSYTFSLKDYMNFTSMGMPAYMFVVESEDVGVVMVVTEDFVNEGITIEAGIYLSDLGWSNIHENGGTGTVKIVLSDEYENLKTDVVHYFAHGTNTTNDGVEYDLSGQILSYTGTSTSVTIPNTLTYSNPVYYEINEDVCVEYYKTNIDTDATDEEALEECKEQYISNTNLSEYEALVSAGVVTKHNGYLKFDNIRFSKTGCIDYYMDMLGISYRDSFVEYCNSEDIKKIANSVINGFTNFIAASESGFTKGLIKYDKEIINHTGNISINVNGIGDSAFMDKSLTSITLPTNLTEIGANAFENNSLTSISLPSSLVYINSYAFNNNKLSGELDLTHLTKIMELYDYTFANNTSLTSVKIPNNITAINSYTFANNTGITSIEIDNVSGSISNSPWGATNATINYLRTE